MESVTTLIAQKRVMIARIVIAAAVFVASYGVPAEAYGWDASEPTIAPGVSVGGVPVSGLGKQQAVSKVEQAYRGRKLTVRIGKLTFSEWPRLLGQRVFARAGVDTAWNIGRDGAPPPPATDVKLKVAVDGARVQRWVKNVSAVVNVRAVNANYRLRNGRPKIFRHRPGRSLKTKSFQRIVTSALTRPSSKSSGFATSLVARTKLFVAVAPKLTVAQLPKVIVIDKSARTLTLWSPTKKIRRFRVAVGQPAYPTPRGTYAVATKQVNPTWTPPDSDWADGAEPIPPGPGNPLGTRWIGLDRNGIGIHGTNNPGSIGSAASHGCIRMYMSDVEWLYARTPIGTKVHVIA